VAATATPPPAPAAPTIETPEASVPTVMLAPPVILTVPVKVWFEAEICWTLILVIGMS
jgi:hypothetical protein